MSSEAKDLSLTQQEVQDLEQLNKAPLLKRWKGYTKYTGPAFLEAAKQIPADQRQEILDRMGQQKEIPTMGRLQYYQAEAEARRQLDTALKQEAQTRERNRTHDRDRGI